MRVCVRLSTWCRLLESAVEAVANRNGNRKKRNKYHAAYHSHLRGPRGYLVSQRDHELNQANRFKSVTIITYYARAASGSLPFDGHRLRLAFIERKKCMRCIMRMPEGDSLKRFSRAKAAFPHPIAFCSLRFC